MHPSEEQFWSLVSLDLAGEATPEQKTELAQLLRANPDWNLRLELYTNLYKSRPKQTPVDESNFSRHLQRLSNHLSEPTLQYEKHPKIRKPWIAAAAAVLLAAAAIYLLKPTTPNNESNTVTTRPGSRSKVQLPDGTTVWLNADSRLSYKVNNTGRDVELTGEAYFDVAKDKDHPFRVHTSTVDVLVLGTTFNLRSYSKEYNTETSLFQGSVEVTLRNNPDKKIILHPEEKITVHNNEAVVTSIKKPEPDADQPLITVGRIHRQQKDSSIIETLWTKNQLYFDDRTLEEVGFMLERWFGVHVTITDDNLKLRRFTGNFEEESLPEVLEALRISSDFHYTIRKKEVIITP
ncbi:MAG TPA: FecR domain-containing protein [Puia sp.]|uniref:FecR family protein n=1 Tax=Puia sp. TaxID=2045100 RepID=UPI002CEFD4B7|nr:FecR domain-containing protein [Puia sp.]HVU98614.1 FecR domain-containing protein [Puia sp.]